MKKISIKLSVALNVVFIALGLCFSGCVAGFVKANVIRPHHDRWVSQFEVHGVQPNDTVFLGDSITDFGAWHEIFPQSHVRNRGIVGDSTMEVYERLDQITRGKPAQVFLMIGTNDLFAGLDQEQIVENIIKIVKKIRQDSPATSIFVQSILPRDESYKERIEALNFALKNRLSGMARWVNLYPLFLDKEGLSMDDALSNDELHLGGKGYLVWRDAISPLVNKY